MPRREITNRDDVIDSRDILERIKELEGERDELVDYIAMAGDTANPAVAELPEDKRAEQLADREKDLRDWDESEEGAELKALKALADEGENCSSDWSHGETLIRSSYWVQWAQEFADDIGAVNKDASWPNDCIDWERAARELAMDYSTVDFDGVEYYIRSS